MVRAVTYSLGPKLYRLQTYSMRKLRTCCQGDHDLAAGNNWDAMPSAWPEADNPGLLTDDDKSSDMAAG